MLWHSSSSDLYQRHISHYCPPIMAAGVSTSLSGRLHADADNAISLYICYQMTVHTFLRLSPASKSCIPLSHPSVEGTPDGWDDWFQLGRWPRILSYSFLDLFNCSITWIHHLLASDLNLIINVIIWFKAWFKSAVNISDGTSLSVSISYQNVRLWNSIAIFIILENFISNS